jgi:hypothetical protein
MILLRSVTSVENLVIIIPTVLMMPVIYCLSNVMNVKQQWKTVVLQNVLETIHLPMEEQVAQRKGLQEIRFSEKGNLML